MSETFIRADEIDWNIFIEHGGDFPDDEGLVSVVDAEGQFVFKAGPQMAKEICDLLNVVSRFLGPR